MYKVQNPASNSLESPIVFIFFWAIANLINEISQGLATNNGVSKIFGLITILGATLLVRNPKSRFGFAILVFFGASNFIFRLPLMPNHFMILGIINLAFAIKFINPKGSLNLNSEIVKNSMKFIQLTTILVYGFAVLSKFNRDFLYSKNSCAFVLPERDLSWFGIQTNLTNLVFLPFTVLGIELIIWIGMLVNRVRHFSFILASIFHLLLSLTPVSQGTNFTFVLLPLIVAFFSTETTNMIQNRLVISKRQLNKFFSTEFFTVILWVCVLFLILDFGIGMISISSKIIWIIELILLSMLCFLVTIMSVIELTRFKVKQFKKLSKISKGQLFFVVLIFINGISPYLGLKTIPTFSMYSNLSVENQDSNHILIPRILRNTWSDDLVTVVKTSNDSLQYDADGGVKINYLELQRFLKFHPDESIEFIRQGRKYSYSKVGESNDLMSPNPIKLKLIAFRKVYQENYCIW